MRLIPIAAAMSVLSAASLAAQPAAAAQPVVTENLQGTITGSKTIDTNGYFGKAGADLTGAKMSVYVQYVPKLLGSSQTCRNHSCTINGSYNMPDTPGSVLVTVTINGHRVVYAPKAEGQIIFPTVSPYQLTVDVDADSSFGIGLPGIQFAVSLASAPVFGQPISPGIQPSTQYSPSNFILFFVPSSQVPSEYLTYSPTGGAK